MNAGDTEVTVRTLVVRAHRIARYQIDYSMEKKADGWKCYDVIVGGVSLVTNYRDEFNDQVQARRRGRPHQDARRSQQVASPRNERRRAARDRSTGAASGGSGAAESIDEAASVRVVR